MKTKMIAFLMVLLLIVLAGCNNTSSNEDKPQPFSSSCLLYTSDAVDEL